MVASDQLYALAASHLGKVPTVSTKLNMNSLRASLDIGAKRKRSTSYKNQNSVVQLVASHCTETSWLTHGHPSQGEGYVMLPTTPINELTV
jgi:hypothetical protein